MPDAFETQVALYVDLHLNALRVGSCVRELKQQLVAVVTAGRHLPHRFLVHRFSFELLSVYLQGILGLGYLFVRTEFFLSIGLLLGLSSLLVQIDASGLIDATRKADESGFDGLEDLFTRLPALHHSGLLSQIDERLPGASLLSLVELKLLCEAVSGTAIELGG